jgi:hypothetical protein
MRDLSGVPSAAYVIVTTSTPVVNVVIWPPTRPGGELLAATYVALMPFETTPQATGIAAPRPVGRYNRDRWSTGT